MKKLLLLSLLCAGLLQAQEPAAPAPAADLAITHVTFKTIGFKFKRNDLFIKPDTGYVQLGIEPSSVSVKAYAYAGPLAMPVYRKVKTPEKTTYELLGQVVFPAGDPTQTGRFLVVFSGGAKPGAMNMTVVDDNLATFPLQTIRVINAFPRPAAVMVNKTSHIIPSGQIDYFPILAENDSRAEIHVAVQHHDKWIEANNNVYSCDTNTRLTVFLVNTTSPTAPAYQPPSIDFLSLLDRPMKKEGLAPGEAATGVAWTKP